ncbi:phage capsid protein [Martelella sp. FOR1707]
MTVQNWFKEVIRDMVRLRYQAMGGYLDGMFMQGDGHAGLIKYPVAEGTIQMYKLTGAIQEIDASRINLGTIDLQVEDFEASAWLDLPADQRKMGPQSKEAIAKLMTKAVRMKRDFLRLDALNAFAAATSTLTDNPKTVETIGDGTTTVTLEDAVYVGDSIAGTGSEEDIFWIMPHSWFSQLMMYKQFSSSEYQGPVNLPFAQASKVKKKTFQGVHMIALPNEMFAYGTGAYGTGSNGLPFNASNYIDTFAWTKDAVGAEIEWDQENMNIYDIPQIKGTRQLAKVQLSGNAVGILPEGVKRIRMKAINKATDPAAA